MDTEPTRKNWIAILTVLNVSYHVLVWTTAILGVAYLVRLTLNYLSRSLRELLEPIPTNGTRHQPRDPAGKPIGRV